MYSATVRGPLSFMVSFKNLAIFIEKQKKFREWNETEMARLLVVVTKGSGRYMTEGSGRYMTKVT